MPFKQYFEGKSVLVTGAGRGIGRGLAKRLHAYGANVYALARTESHLETLKSECPGIQTICVDLVDWEKTRNALDNVGPFNYLINNAAILIPGNFMDVKPGDFDKMMTVNVQACINVGQIVAKGMIDAGIEGSIVNVSSVTSSSAFPPTTIYCLTKAAIDMLTKIMAVELGPKKIRVNSINSAGIPSDMLQTFYEGIAETQSVGVDELKKNLNSRVPLRNFEMKKDEIVNSILFLLSPLSPLIHGESLFVDGGFRHA